MEKADMLTEQTIWDILRQIPDPELPTINLVDLGVIRKVEVGDSILVELLPTFIGCPALDMMSREIMEKLAPYGPVEVKIVYSDAWTTECISEAGREMLRQAKIVPPPVPNHAGPVGDDAPLPGPATRAGDDAPLPGHPQGVALLYTSSPRATCCLSCIVGPSPCGWPAGSAEPGSGAGPAGVAGSGPGAAPAVGHGNFIELPARASRLTPRSHAPDTSVAVACPYCGSSNTSQENLFGPTPCRAICYCHNCHQPFERFKTV